MEGTPGDPPPDLEPEANVYDAATTEAAGARFSLSGSIVQPGSREVTMDLEITSELEYVGYSAAGRFPAEHLELVRIDVPRAGSVSGVENESGSFWLVSDGTLRRVAAEGETKRVATLVFDVRESAPAGAALEVTLEEQTHAFPNVRNRLHVRAPDANGGPPVKVEVEPLLVAHGLLRVTAERTLSGDVNVDAVVDLTDPVVLLGVLFLDTSAVICPAAADFNADETLNVTDAVAILNHLFLGGPRWLDEVDCAAASE